MPDFLSDHTALPLKALGISGVVAKISAALLAQCDALEAVEPPRAPRFHIIETLDGWGVFRPDVAEEPTNFLDREQALAFGLELSHEFKRAEVVVHNADGSVMKRFVLGQ